MKFMKSAAAVCGLIALVVLGFFIAKVFYEVGNLVSVANANKSQGFASPMRTIMTATGLAGLAGLLLGLGLGMPTKTAGGIRKEALRKAELAQQAQNDQAQAPVEV